MPRDSSTVGRRAFLRGTGAAAVATGGVAIATGPAAAAHDTAKPEHVTLSFDETTLERYRPRLVTRHLDVSPSKQYAWLATSPEHDTDAYTYWTWYVTQEGLTDRDSHYLDREPVYVFVDAETDEISEVVYSGYHWLAARTRSPTTDVDDHPLFQVAERYHHYYRTGDDTGELVDLADMDAVFDEWIDNGWEEDLEPGAAQYPWLLASVDSGASRAHWWRENSLGFSWTAQWMRLWKRLGLRGADEADAVD